MKIQTASLTSAIIPALVYLGLPTSFIAAAFHAPSPHLASSIPPSIALGDHTAWLFPILFISVVLSVAVLLVHHLREEHRLDTFTDLHLRHSGTIASRSPIAPRNPSLVTVSAI